MLGILEIKSMKNINGIQVIQDSGSLAQTSVLIHKSYVSKMSKNNSIYLDQKSRSRHIYKIHRSCTT